MVALRNPERRDYPMGPPEHDRPDLRLYEPAKTLSWPVQVVLIVGAMAVVAVVVIGVVR